MLLFRPVNQAELDLIRQANWKSFPPRLAGQPIFYPVLNQEYATEITTQWNVPTFGIGHVVQFEINDTYISNFKVQKVGLDHHLEFWIPSEELDNFNKNIIGAIQLISTFQ